MRPRMALIPLVIAMIAASAAAMDLDFRYGARVEFGLPVDTVAYGSWVPALDSSPSSPDFLLIPALFQGIDLGSGIMVDLEERFIQVSSNNSGWEYDLMVIPVTVTGRYQFFSGWDRPVSPYLGLGAGAYYYDNELDGVAEDGIVPGFHAVAGMSLDFESGVKVEIQARYESYSFDAPYEVRTYDPDAEVWLFDRSIRELDGDLVGISLGLQL